MQSQGVGAAAAIAEDSKLLAEILADDLFELRSAGSRCKPTILQTCDYSFNFLMVVRFKFVWRVPDGFVVLSEGVVNMKTVCVTGSC